MPRHIWTLRYSTYLQARQRHYYSSGVHIITCYETDTRLNNLTGKPEKSMYTHIYSILIVHISISRRTCISKLFGLTQKKHTVSCPCSWTVTVRSNRSCWLCLIKMCCFLLQLYAKLSTFTPSGFPLTCVQPVTLCVCVRVCVCVCVCEYGCSHSRRYTLRLMSARVHPSRREKLPEQSGLNTLLHRKHHTSLMPSFRCPTGHRVAKHMLVLTSSNLFLQLIFSKASCSMKTFEWHTVCSVLLLTPQRLISLCWLQSKALTEHLQ